ncbi:hypothetical protein [Methylophaga pinxianii]|uniref:hypothetical protein n=1 Tax=Methylophaga pinxianii TaxID=2881052 RepID=UPI001CF345F4|nr:hypothetical protein [Methylophaga pinxianii]MCB2426777.1 hypothetical protein [Methylophaga pinxianii]UPH46542.1 hypothetical protein LGT42_004460 [Methylophaga pinxianii]
MRIPTDLEILNTIYRIYHSDFVAFERGDGARDSRIYVPIDCKKIAGELKVDPDIVFGRLYYHLEKQYGYKQDDGSNVHFFARKVGNDPRCINFPLMTSVLAGLRQEKRKFWIGTAIAILALVVSAVSLTVSVTQSGGSNKSMLPTVEAAAD